MNSILLKSKTFAPFLIAFIVMLNLAAGGKTDVTKGAELLVKRPSFNPRNRTLETQGHAANASANATSIQSFSVILINFNEVSGWLLEATLRDSTDSVVGVDRLNSDGTREIRLTVRTFRRNLSLLKEAIETSLAQTCRNSFLSDTNLDSARKLLANSKVEEIQGELVIQFIQSEAQREISQPSPPLVAMNCTNELKSVDSSFTVEGKSGSRARANAESSQEIHKVKGRKPISAGRQSGGNSGAMVVGLCVSFLGLALMVTGLWVSIRTAARLVKNLRLFRVGFRRIN